jgi:predicted RNase H-like nuclease (RuvC/YqgF family)
MDSQDNKFNYKIILGALVAVIIGILIAFYYSYAQSNAQINFLEQEKALLVKDLTIMKADVDHLSTLSEVYEIELETSKYKVQQLLDSVGRLNFTIDKLREFKTELRRLEAKNDSLRLKNNFLRYNNMLLTDKYEESRNQIEILRANSSSLAEAEALQRRKILELNQKLKTKSYLKLQNSEGSGFRMRSSRPIKTNKASTIEKLRGCVTVVADPSELDAEKILYFQFLDPNKQIVEDNANTITVNGNIYSKRVEFVFMGVETNICDFITIPEGSLQEGVYTLNVFEDERLLASSEFQLK